jgi:hypothetical protein
MYVHSRTTHVLPSQAVVFRQQLLIQRKLGFDIRCSTMIDRNPFADTEGKFNGGVKTALVWDGTYHRVCHGMSSS